MNAVSEFAGDLLNRRRSKMDKIAVNAFIHGGAISDLSQQYRNFLDLPIDTEKNLC